MKKEKQRLIRKLKNDFEFKIVNMLTFPSAKVNRYMSVGKKRQK